MKPAMPQDPHLAEVITKASMLAHLATREAEKIVAQESVSVQQAAAYIEKLRLLDRTLRESTRRS